MVYLWFMSDIYIFQSVAGLIARADKTKMSPLDVTELIYDAKQPDIKPAVKQRVGPFIKTVRVLRKLANEVTSVSVCVEIVSNSLGCISA